MDMSLVKSAIRLAGVLLLVGALLFFALPNGPSVLATILLVIVAMALAIFGSSGIPAATPVAPPAAPPVVLSPATSVVAETNFDLASRVGAASEYARGDHTHGTPALPSVAGDIAGSLAFTRVVRLQGVPISNTPPVANQVLTFNGQSWEARTPS